uniref:Phosphatidylinositol phosphatase PTPRQ-like n=1 Tax=Crassostrea virginica TaxID=6565 RepID=A0A8B8AQK9_CRAVI|nr:phosphatidylinositol phosphatase PTPRQ-like [Crassostrea virginica]
MASIRGPFVWVLILGLFSACCIQSASKEATTMVTDSRLEQMTLTICRKNTDCSFPNSICSDACGAFSVCQCIDEYVLTKSSVCTPVNLFKVTDFSLKNVTEDSIVVEWSTIQNFPGVMVSYTVTFSGSINSHVSSPYLIKNLSDGEVQSVQITSNVRGRDGGEATAMSDVKFTRTVPKAPEFVPDQSYAAPSATISWTPQNPDVDVFYVTLTGPGVSFSNVTNETSITFSGLGPGMNYTVTVVQQTNEPYATKSSKATFEFHTNSTEPGPPKAIEVINVGQRIISLNITDTDTPNGDIAGYVFKLRYKIYSDTDYMERTTFLSKTASSIYYLQHHIVPGVTYMIAVFTRNNAFYSSTNVILDNVTTSPDTPGEVSVLHPQQTNQTTTSGFIRWGRPDSPNGNMKAYRVVLNGRPNIIQCRLYFLCIGMCPDILLGPPYDTCGIQNGTALVENQREISLLVDNLRVGTTYTLSVVGYTEAGAGNLPRQVTLTTLSIVPAAVNSDSFQINFPSNGPNFRLKWAKPTQFPGEDLTYLVILRDQLIYRTLETVNTTSLFYAPNPSVSGRLYNYYKYSITVRSMTSAGPADSRTYSFLTPSKGDLGRPQSLKINMLPDDCKFILISWTEADIEARNGPILQYIFENRDGTDKWKYYVSSPNYWAVTNRQFIFELSVREQATYSLEIYAKSSNQTGVTYTTQRFQTNKCRKFMQSKHKTVQRYQCYM